MNRHKVLLVDDRRENLLALEALLRSEEIEFFKATSGVEALDLLLNHEFSAALIDVQMPEMDGFELAELMRGPEQTRSVPIIFVTAGTRDRLSTFKGYEKGAVDFLYKPLEPQIVKSKVQVFLELARQRQLLEAQLKETQNALRERDLALAKAQEALLARDEFMSIASHELKTPLTSLHLRLQIVNRAIRRTGPADALGAEKVAESLAVCESQTSKLSALIDGLLDLTRVRLGKLELAREELDLCRLAREVTERFKVDARQKGVEITLEAGERGAGTGILGRWDPTRVEQVLGNLLSNAIKYGNCRPVHVSVAEDRQARLARVVVRDQGMGIPEDLQDKIFKRFERAVSGRQISGLGLGLYITRQIVEAHGGRISVVSRIGEGSTFTVELPLRAEFA